MTSALFELVEWNFTDRTLFIIHITNFEVRWSITQVDKIFSEAVLAIWHDLSREQFGNAGLGTPIMANVQGAFKKSSDTCLYYSCSYILVAPSKNNVTYK